MPTGSLAVSAMRASKVSIALFGLAPLVPIRTPVQTRVFVTTKQVNANVSQAGAAATVAGTWDSIMIADID
jgi:hypothetical protein